MMSRKCRAMAHRWKWPLEDGMRTLINFCVFCVRFSVCVMYVKWHVCFAGECPSYFYRRYRQTVLVHLACVCAGCCCSNPTIASKKKADIRCMWEKVSTKCLQIELKWCVRNQQAANSIRKTTKTHKPNRKSLNCLWNYQSFLIRNIFIHSVSLCFEWLSCGAGI